MTQRPFPTFALTAAMALALAACGDRTGPAADPASTPPTGAPTTGADAAGDAAAGAGETAGADPSATQPTVTRSTWVCGDLTVNVAYDPIGDAVTLNHAGGTLTLPSQVSGSGARYADDAGNEFWDSGDEAMLTLAGAERRDCTRQ